MMITYLSMSTDELASAIVDGADDLEELLKFFIRCDELIAEVGFTRRLHEHLGKAIAAEEN